MSVSSSLMQLDHIPAEMGGKAPVYLNVTESCPWRTPTSKTAVRDLLQSWLPQMFVWAPIHRACKIKSQTSHNVRQQQKYVILQKKAISHNLWNGKVFSILLSVWARWHGPITFPACSIKYRTIWIYYQQKRALDSFLLLVWNQSVMLWNCQRAFLNLMRA